MGFSTRSYHKKGALGYLLGYLRMTPNGLPIKAKARMFLWISTSISAGGRLFRPVVSGMAPYGCFVDLVSFETGFGLL